MQCPNCRTQYGEEDVYCRQCGTDLVEEPSKEIVPTQTRLPALLQNTQLSRGVAAGVGALALGVGLEILRRSLLSRVTKDPQTLGNALSTLGNLSEVLPTRTEKTQKLPKGYEVYETVVYMQRVIRRVN